jgi:hypothetical protein
MFHLTGVECKPPHPMANFSKANWGNHFRYNAGGRMFSVHPTSTLINLVHQLKPRQWEKILAAATEDSKINLNSKATLFALSSSTSLPF